MGGTNCVLPGWLPIVELLSSRLQNWIEMMYVQQVSRLPCFVTLLPVHWKIAPMLGTLLSSVPVGFFLFKYVFRGYVWPLCLFPFSFCQDSRRHFCWRNFHCLSCSPVHICYYQFGNLVCSWNIAGSCGFLVITMPLPLDSLFLPLQIRAIPVQIVEVSSELASQSPLPNSKLIVALLDPLNCIFCPFTYGLTNKTAKTTERYSLCYLHYFCWLPSIITTDTPRFLLSVLIICLRIQLHMSSSPSQRQDCGIYISLFVMYLNTFNSLIVNSA